MEFEEDIKRWLTPAELSQLEEITRRLLGDRLDKTVDEKAQAKFEPFAKTILLRKELEKTLAAISPPLDDARRYLDEEELKLFQDSLRGAVAAYLGPRWLGVESSWMLSPLACNYEVWLSIIRSRREEEQRRWQALEAQLKASEQAIRYSVRLNGEIERFRQQLHPEKEKLESVFSKLCTDLRYLGYSLSCLLAPEDRQELETEVLKWIRTRAVPDNLAPFITYEFEVQFFPLLSAEYTLEGELPALDFVLESYGVVQVGYWLRPTTVKFSDIPVAVPMKVYNGYAVTMKSSEFLGYGGYLLTPDELRNAPAFFWQTIPLILVERLMDGKPPPQGAVILDASAVGATYKIAGEEIDIPGVFADYLATVKKCGGLLSLGIIPAKVAEVLQHLPPAPLGGPSKQVETGDDKDLLDALLALGYKAAEAKEALASTSFPADATLEQKVQLVFQGGKLDKDNNLTTEHSAQNE